MFTLPGCSKAPVDIDEEKVYALLTDNPSIMQYTLKSGRSQHIYLPKSFDYKCFVLYERDMFLVADNSEYVYRLVNRDGEVVSNGGLRTEKNDDAASCMEYNAVNDVLAIVFPHRIDIIEVGSSLLKTCVQMEHCLDVASAVTTFMPFAPVPQQTPINPITVVFMCSIWKGTHSEPIFWIQLSADSA